MKTRTYPTIDAKLIMSLQAIDQLAEGDPEYLTAPECNYSPAVKLLLKRFLTKPAVAGVVDGDVAEGDIWSSETTLRKLTAAFKKLEDLEVSSDDTKERMSALKLQVSLLEKVTDLQRELTVMKDHEDFQRSVIDIIENVLTEDQRDSVMAALTTLTSK